MEIDFKRTAELVVQIQNGDDSAFEELYHLTSKRAFFLAKEFVKNDDDAEDILQDSYIKALAKINELENPETFVSWFNRIVANKSKDYIKKKKPSLFECDEDEAYEVIADENMTFSPEENVDKEDLRKTVMQALDELSEDKKACIVMMYYEENSIGEIAKCLEIPEGTVKTRLYHGRNELKRCFERAGVTSLYSAAPIGIIIWALRSSAQTAQASFAASPAYTSVLAGVKAAAVSTAAAATAASTATAGTAVATAAASTAATTVAGTTVATGVTAKVVAIVAAGAVIIGGGATAAKVAHDKRAEETTTAVTEQSTELSSENIEVIATEGSTEATIEYKNSIITVSNENGTTHITVTLNKTDNTTKSDVLQSTGPPDTVKTTIQNKTTAQATTVKRTTKPATTEKQTTVAPSATKKQSASGGLSGSVTTTVRVTTTKPTTTAQTTAKPTTTAKQTTTQAPTTTQPATVGTATVVISVYNGDWQLLKTITNIEVAAGSYITANTLKTEVLKHTSEYGEHFTGLVTIEEGEIISSAPGVEQGKTYYYKVMVS
ncbi:MAG: sigma-70 family RNA polymerase sigma factor [Clostridia bacterium]|nr:sigma-70 family RNA polymerase sigma factor [Clostridia bacterium]